MRKFLGKWLDLYQDEVALFLWSALILFLIRTSNILFNNFAETAFLKRFGVQYLPYITAANSVTTFFIMGLLAGVLVKVPGSRLLTYTLILCGSSVAALRLLTPLDIGMLYPLLYIMKSQYELLFGFLFWNLANDLFNTRQSKRIFPLITAGGICGGIIGSFCTPPLAELISINNLMVIYLFTTLAGAAAVKRMSNLYPSVLVTGDMPRTRKDSSGMADEFKKVLPMLRESRLAKVLLLLTLLPNIVIPIMNYQFSFAVNQTYATENGMIAFFGYFRGAQNTVALIISLFAGKLYARFGIPVALMFHPVNYLIAFFAFLFRFDIFSAMYARLSTAVLRNAVNNPARAVLYGLFPLSHRTVMRAFLRGTVVRVGILAGSGAVLLSQHVMHPRYLSLVGAVAVLTWIGTTVYFRRYYSQILTGLISRETFDLKAMGEQEGAQVFSHEGVQPQLLQSFLSSHGDDCVWYGQMLQSAKMEGLDRHILTKLREEDDRTKMRLLPLLSSRAGTDAVEVFGDLIDPGKPELMIALAGTVKRVYADIPMEMLAQARYPEVKAVLLTGLYEQAPREYGRVIASWLDSESLAERRGGVLAAGELGRREYEKRLREMLTQEEDSSIIPLILEALGRLGIKDINETAVPFLSHGAETVRAAALRVLVVESDEVVKMAVLLMGDSSDHVRDVAIEKLSAATYRVARVLVESLTIPSRRIRDGIFRIFKTIQVKDVEVFRFFQSQLETGYRNLAEAEALGRLEPSEERDLLIAHLVQEKDARVENVLRTLSVRDPEGQMRVIWRGLSSGDSRQRANSVEALENTVDPSLLKILLPLLETDSVEQTLAAGRKIFRLPEPASEMHDLFSRLLEKEDWLTKALALRLVHRIGTPAMDRKKIKDLCKWAEEDIRKTAAPVPRRLKGREARGAASIPDRIIHMKRIGVFQELTVRELALISAVAEEFAAPAHQTIFQSGDVLNRIHFIVKGEVSVMEETEGRSRQLFLLGEGETLGAAAFFAEVPPGISVHTNTPTQFLVLPREPFREMVMEYPEIALGVCTDLANRILLLHEKIKACESEIERP